MFQIHLLAANTLHVTVIKLLPDPIIYILLVIANKRLILPEVITNARNGLLLLHYDYL